VSGIRHKSPIDDWKGGRRSGADPERRDYPSVADFADPDGNTWVIQEITLRLACLTAVRNQRTLAAYHLREQDNNRRATAGLPPRTRKRRRALAGTSANAPP
jgi:hypothetical protein